MYSRVSSRVEYRIRMCEDYTYFSPVLMSKWTRIHTHISMSYTAHTYKQCAWVWVCVVVYDIPFLEKKYRSRRSERKKRTKCCLRCLSKNRLSIQSIHYDVRFNDFPVVEKIKWCTRKMNCKFPSIKSQEIVVQICVCFIRFA